VYNLTIVTMSNYYQQDDFEDFQILNTDEASILAPLDSALNTLFNLPGVDWTIAPCHNFYGTTRYAVVTICVDLQEPKLCRSDVYYALNTLKDVQQKLGVGVQAFITSVGLGIAHSVAASGIEECLKYIQEYEL
jgi:hypothetical protein